MVTSLAAESSYPFSGELTAEEPVAVVLELAWSCDEPSLHQIDAERLTAEELVPDMLAPERDKLALEQAMSHTRPCRVPQQRGQRPELGDTTSC